MALQNSSIDDMNTFLNKKYYIPNYQREYSWENEELEDFWNDLIATNEDSSEVHFFGQVVVHDDPDQKKKFIIDGQQRTTTSVILLRAMQVNFDTLFKLTSEKKASYKSQDIESKYLGREDERHLTLGELDNDYFEKEILSGEPDKENKKKKKSHERLRKAYVYFDDKIKELFEDAVDDDDKLTMLTTLYTTFTEQFKVLYMEATKLEEAFVIFETLNARGRDLETADLLKNYILNQSKEIETSLKKWNSMINKLDKCDPTKFIRHYWNSSNSFTREKALYRAINRNISTPKNTKELLTDLDTLAQYYHDMVVPTENSSFSDSELVKVFKALKTLKASTFYPVILAMKKQSEFDEKDILKVAQKIECYVFRNFTVCGKTANSAEVYFAGIAKSIYDEKLTTADDICDEIKKGIVSDDEFEDAFKRWTGSKSAKETIRYMLRKIHQHLDTANELNVDNTEVHIEHIMPEDKSKWNISDDVHEAYLWRLGNLCLLSGTYNISISNKPFSDKQDIYDKSKIEPNSTIKNYLENGKWNGKAISDRQDKFAEYALKIWAK